jgi:hypothetical protein
MGRVQQTLNEYSEKMDFLERFLQQKELDRWGNELEEMGRQIRDLEKHAIQMELATAELERLGENEKRQISHPPKCDIMENYGGENLLDQ